MARARTKGGTEDLIRRASDKVRRTYKGVISERASSALELPSVFVSTGSLVLDRLCAGVNPGGFPIGPRLGRVVHMAGEWSTGKSLILDHVFKSAQDVGGVCLVSETEGTRDTHFADAIGLDLDLLEVQRPATLEEAVDQGLTFHDEIRRSAGGASLPFVWGLDSLDSSETQRTADKGLSDSGAWHYGGGKSEALGAGLKKIVQRCARFPTTFILLNQTRDVVQTGPMQFGPKKRTSGGNAPHFYCSLELMLSPSSLGLVRAKSPMQPLGKDMIRKLGLYGADKGWVIGRWIRAKVAKTKIAPTLFDEGDFYVDFRRGVHRWGGLLQTMLREGRIELTPDGSGVRMRMAKDAVEFETQGAWLEWMTQHLDVLRVPKGTNAVPAEPETEGTEDAE